MTRAHSQQVVAELEPFITQAVADFIYFQLTLLFPSPKYIYFYRKLYLYGKTGKNMSLSKYQKININPWKQSWDVKSCPAAPTQDESAALSQNEPTSTGWTSEGQPGGLPGGGVQSGATKWAKFGCESHRGATLRRRKPRPLHSTQHVLNSQQGSVKPLLAPGLHSRSPPWPASNPSGQSFPLTSHPIQHMLLCLVSSDGLYIDPSQPSAQCLLE